MAAFYYAANAGIDVVSISFGGYLDRSDPDQDLDLPAGGEAVNYATHKGTMIVAAVGQRAHAHRRGRQGAEPRRS